MFANKSTLVSVPTSESENLSQIFRILTIIGGCCSLAVSKFMASYYHIIVIVDVPREIAKYRKLYRHFKNVYYYPIGEGQTAASLFATAPPNLKQCIGRLAPLNAEDGMGALSGIGYQAITTALKTPEHARFLQFLVNLAVIETKGAPRSIHGVTAFGGAGGTGSSAPAAFSRSMIEAFSILEVPVDWNYECVGSVTFTGVAMRADLNAASTQWRLLRDLIRKRPAHLPLLVEHVRFIEFPPFGHDWEARSQEIFLDQQSVGAQEVRLHFSMIKPNCAMNGPFGLASSWTMDRTECLSLREDVAPYVAPTMLTYIRNALRDASPVASRIVDIVSKSQSTPLSRESVESLLEKPRHVDTCLAELRRPAKAQQLRLLAVSQDGHEFDLSRINVDFQHTPTTLTEFTRSLLDLSSIAAALDNEMAEIRDRIATLESDVTLIEGELQELLPQCWRSRPGWGKRNQRLAAKCQAAARDLREFSDELFEQRELLDALGTAHYAVRREADFRRAKLEQIAECLDNFIPRGTLHADRPTPIILKAADDIFPQLLSLPGLPPVDQLSVLGETVAAVTIDGLAKLLGVAHARLESVAEAVVQGQFPLQGPPHGAKVQRREGQQVLVLPPLPESLRQTLVEMLARLRPELVVAVADTAAAGVAVIRYTVFSSDSLRELFPGRMWADLRRAYESDLRDLYFPDGTDGLADDLAQN